MSLKSGKITPRDVVKYFAVRRWLFFEKSSFDEFRDGLRDLGLPVPNAGVEYPPMKNAIYCVLCPRLPGHIV